MGLVLKSFEFPFKDFSEYYTHGLREFAYDRRHELGLHFRFFALREGEEPTSFELVPYDERKFRGWMQKITADAVRLVFYDPVPFCPLARVHVCLLALLPPVSLACHGPRVVFVQNVADEIDSEEKVNDELLKVRPLL